MLTEGITAAEPSLVRLTAAALSWTGVMVEESGLILAPSSLLGRAPVVDFTTEAGRAGRAWVIGRDDTLDFALLEVLDPTETFDAIRSAPPGAAAAVDAELAVLQYTGGAPVLDRRPTRVVGIRLDFNTRITYIQLSGGDVERAQGGALIGNDGTLLGIRMSTDQVGKLGIARPGEIYAISIDSINTVVLPRLRAGVTVIATPEPTEGASQSPRPGFPQTFRGAITSGGEPAPVGSTLYSVVSKSGRPDVWFTREIVVEGRYLIPLGVPQADLYVNATVDFWFDAKQSSRQSAYVEGASRQLDLAFP